MIENSISGERKRSEFYHVASHLLLASSIALFKTIFQSKVDGGVYNMMSLTVNLNHQGDRDEAHPFDIVSSFISKIINFRKHGIIDKLGNS